MNLILAEEKESSAVVKPTKVTPSASVRFSFEKEPTIGIQGLFEDFKRPVSFPSSSQISSSFEDIEEKINPSSVRYVCHLVHLMLNFNTIFFLHSLYSLNSPAFHIFVAF